MRCIERRLCCLCAGCRERIWCEAFYNVLKELNALELELIRMKDVEPLSERRRKHTLPNDLETAIDGLSSAHRLALGTLHAFMNSDSA